MVVPLVQLAVVAACLLVTALAAGSWAQVAPAVALAANVVGLRALTRESAPLVPPWRRPSLDAPVAALGAILLVPALLFGVDMILGFREGRPPTDDDTWGVDHWPTQAALAFSLVAVAVAVAAGVRGRWRGTATSAACVAVAAGWFGYWSAAYPDHAGSAGRVPGLALMAWACAFAVLVWWRLRRS
jgi:hypothetical protein